MRRRRILSGIALRLEAGSRRDPSIEGCAVRQERRQEDARSVHVRRFLLMVCGGPARVRAANSHRKHRPRDLHRHGQAILVRDDGDSPEGRQLIKILAAWQRVPADFFEAS
jgi:hypothetical protein